MAKNISSQILCAIGENLASAQLLAHNWPTANVNRSIPNFKGIDLYCQKDPNSVEVIGVQVKTVYVNSAMCGISCGVAANISELQKHIVGPWIFVHIKNLVPLDVDYYILSRTQIINLLYETHKWYLYNYKRQPSQSLIDSPSALKIKWLQGDDDNSPLANIPFKNPYPKNIFLDNWDNLWR